MEFVKRFALRSNQKTSEDEQVAQPTSTSPYPNEKEKDGGVTEDHVSALDEKSLSSDDIVNPGTLSFEEGIYVLSTSIIMHTDLLINIR